MAFHKLYHFQPHNNIFPAGREILLVASQKACRPDKEYILVLLQTTVFDQQILLPRFLKQPWYWLSAAFRQHLKLRTLPKYAARRVLEMCEVLNADGTPHSTNT